MAYHNDLGVKGEELAVRMLMKKGYAILERNYRYQRAEIDIIAEEREQLVIVEVKTRNSDYFGDPQSFVTATKIKHLVRAADHYITENQIQKEVRFDIVAVLLNKEVIKIEHYTDAFYHF